MSLLPINKQTIIYGSDDGGEVIHSDDNTFASIIEKLGTSLNIKPRRVNGDNVNPEITLFTAIDVEGHLGTDDRYYLLDLSRMFPPTTPNKDLTAGHLFQLFRPEFLKTYGKALCPDAFSKFLKKDPNRTEHNKEVREATDYLLHNIVPPFAKSIKWVILEAKQQKALLELDIVQEFHRKGVNLRMIGYVLEHLEDPDSIMILLVEAIARVIKNDINHRLRTKMQQFAVPVTVPYRQLIVDTMNMVFCDNRKAESDDYWIRTIEADLVTRFHLSTSFTMDIRKPVPLLSSEIRSPPSSGSSLITSRLRNILTREISDTNISGRYLLFHRFCRISNFSFRSSTFAKVAGSPNLEFDIMDLKKIKVRLKNAPLITNAEGTFLYSKAFQERTTEGILDLFMQAREKFELALRSNPTDKTTLKLAAITSLKILEFTVSKGKNIANVRFDMKDPQTAHTDLIFLRALDAEQSSHLLFLYARFLDKCGREERANEYFLRSLEGDPNNPRALEAYAGFLNEHYPTAQHDSSSSPSQSSQSSIPPSDPFSPSNISDLFFARRSLLADFHLRKDGKWERISTNTNPTE
eukprot:TRINITY_DN550_c0_g3_i1.p1 TRINITY_DN550_c0_g3~~TRINITY_DN550_c0_g3_i1.p1  ORF type:complete len:579 (+),score=100.97 TRINITY_DN550_c0_g3_i1:43-1779(+)